MGWLSSVISIDSLQGQRTRGWNPWPRRIVFCFHKMTVLFERLFYLSFWQKKNHKTLCLNLQGYLIVASVDRYLCERRDAKTLNCMLYLPGRVLKSCRKRKAAIKLKRDLILSLCFSQHSYFKQKNTYSVNEMLMCFRCSSPVFESKAGRAWPIHSALKCLFSLMLY